MNRRISRIGAAVVCATVFLFAVCLIADYSFGSYLVCMLLPLGYGMMALSTFFIGLSLQAESRADLWLKRLLMLNGLFFISCFVMPMTGIFSGMSDGETSRGGAMALVIWCVYFLPVGALAYRHFSQ